MALIIYPDTGADSFVTVAEADAYISSLSLQSADWLALTEPTKETYLRIAYRYILDNTDQSLYTDPMPDCIKETQSLMAVHDLKYGFSDTQSATTGAIKKQKVGALEQEFYDTANASSVSNRVPSIGQACLEQFGYSAPSTAQTTLGRS